MSGVTLHGSVLQVESARHQGDACERADIFATYPWFQNLELNARPPGADVIVAEFVGMSGQLLALPMFASKGRVEAMANFYTPVFSPITVGPLDFADAATALVSALLDRGYLSLKFGPLQSGGQFCYSMQIALRRHGYAVWMRPTQVNWYLDASGLGWDRYLASRPSRLRNTIVRNERRLRTSHNFEVAILSKLDARLEAAICAYETVYARSWKREEPYPHFMPSLCRTGAQEGWLRLGVLSIEDRAVAAQVWFHSAGVTSIYKLAYDKDYANLGVGTVLMAELFRHSLEVDRATKIDFLTGDEPYKQEWMSHRQVRVELAAIHPRSPSNWGRLAWQVGHRVRSLVPRPERPAAAAAEPSRLDEPELSVVVGLCAHGLAIVRALADAGVMVVALESNVSLPGYRTRRADVVQIPDINGESLISSLLELSAARFGGRQPTLLLTNDTMVAVVAKHVDRIRGHYRLSWQDCADDVSRLLRKENIETRCRETGLSYPKGQMVTSHDSLMSMPLDLEFPVIAKPTKPLSTFKTLVAHSRDELVERIRPHSASAPYLVQQFIPGGDEWIHFCALYLDRGRIVAHFEGHKLRSRPMGHTTIAETQSDSALLDYTRRFFDGLGLSGPVSLEVKRDAAGTMWVIEPTVGRTDFWVGLCIRAGISLPAIEHFSQIGDKATINQSPRNVVWFNAERDPLALAWLTLKSPWVVLEKSIAALYYDPSDLRPWYSAVAIQAEEIMRSVWRRTLGLVIGR